MAATSDRAVAVAAGMMILPPIPEAPGTSGAVGGGATALRPAEGGTDASAAAEAAAGVVPAAGVGAACAKGGRVVTVAEAMELPLVLPVPALAAARKFSLLPLTVPCAVAPSDTARVMLWGCAPV